MFLLWEILICVLMMELPRRKVQVEREGLDVSTTHDKWVHISRRRRIRWYISSLLSQFAALQLGHFPHIISVFLERSADRIRSEEL